MLLPQRTADYFVVVGRGRQDAGAGRAAVPEVLDRFPENDHKDAEFPKDLPMFCFPKGISTVEHRGSQPPPSPFLHCFALTEEDGARVYGSCFTYWVQLGVEETEKLISLYSQDVDGSTSEDVQFYYPESICLTSHWPFYDNFSQFLQGIHAGVENSQTQPLATPVERMITNLIFETPLPPRGRTMVNYVFLQQKITFSRPPPNELPVYCLSISKFFQTLSVNSIVTIFGCMLTEKRLLFVSEALEKLTLCVETLAYFMFPFVWRQIYVPVLPKRLIDFVCAPMPFCVGIHKSYMPDPDLLSGVVVVDLDNDTIVADQESDKIEDLPDKLRAKMIRGLKRVTGVDASVVCDSGFSTTMDKVSPVFLKFFVLLMKKYRDYVEAPSEFVVDKFRKQQWVQEHSHRCEFLVQFVATQHFQCFVDDRYEASSDNLEVLLFDEAIDSASGKNTAFLTDTSNIHKEVHRVIPPFSEDFESTSKFVYAGFHQLNHELFRPIRDVPPLFDRSKESDFQKTGLSYVSMKFFADKNLYSRHFHSLRVRSNKQDLAFRDLVQYLRLHQGYVDCSSREFGKIAQVVLNSDTIETSTTVDLAWKGILEYVEAQNLAESEFRLSVRDKVYKTMYSKANAVEQELKVLFAEANELDRLASSGKTLVDDCRVRYYKNRAQLKQLEGSLKSSDLFLNPGEITKKVLLESEIDNRFLKKVQAETSFRGIVSLYECRMPEMVETVRRLNAERISTCKESLQNYVSSYKGWIQALQQSVDTLERAVGKLNVENDLKTFREGKMEFLDFQASRLSDGSISSTGSFRNHHPSSGLLDGKALGLTVSAPSPRHSTSATAAAPIPSHKAEDRPLRYSLDLWGEQGFQIAHAQAVRTKATVKVSLHALEELAVALEARCKGSLKSLKSLSSTSAVSASSQAALWACLLSFPRDSASWTKSLSEGLRVLAGSQRVLKGVIKNLYHVSIIHRDGLAAELDASLEAVSKAREKRDRLFEVYETLQKREAETFDDPKASLARIEKARAEFRHADNASLVSKRSFLAQQEKHDISMGYLMDLFQEKEKRQRQELRRDYSKIVKLWGGYLKNLRKQSHELKGKAQEICMEADLREFVKNNVLASAPPQQPLGEGPVDLALHLGDITASSGARSAIFDLCSKLMARGEAFTKQLVQFCEEDISSHESFAKALLRGKWAVPSSWKCSLSRVFESWEKFVLGLARAHERYAILQREKVCWPLIEARSFLKTNSSAVAKQYASLLRDVEPIYAAHSKAEADLRKAFGALDGAREKMKRLEDVPKEPNRKARIMQKFTTSIEKQTSKVSLCEKELHQSQGDVERASKVLAKTKEMELKRFAEVLEQVKEQEMRREKMMKEALEGLVTCRMEFESKVKDLLKGLEVEVGQVDPLGDIAQFIQANPTGLEPPESVMKDFLRQVEEKEEIEASSARTSLAGTTKRREETIDKQATEAIMERIKEIQAKKGISMEEDPLAEEGSDHVSSISSFRPSSPAATTLVMPQSQVQEFEWEEMQDQRTKEFYYVNVVTGESQWDRPAADVRPWKDSDFYRGGLSEDE